MAVALASHQGLHVEVHHDERSAGFVALGIGLATGHPALVLTTSGTAAVELHPAVVEAHQGSVPLVVLTADRPPDLHHVGAAQTVDQVHLYGRSVQWFADPGVPDAAALVSARSLAARAVAEATTGTAGPGPVQLNLAFREPLVGLAGPLPPPRADGARWHTTIGRRSALDRAGTERLTQLLDADRGVIVAGEGAGEAEVVLQLAAATGWPLLADPRSGCRVAAPQVVGAFDAILRDDSVAAALHPDVVLQLGAPPASKVLAQWLSASGATRVAVDGHGRWFDADHQAAHVLHADPTAAAQALARLVGGRAGENTAWSGAWHAVEQAAQGAIDRALAAFDDPTEPGIARAVAAALPAGSTLVVSSSMPVRDLEWYAAPGDGPRVLANRGANGIDGVLSTAVGVAVAGSVVSASTAVLIGDVAFLHDVNGLLGLRERRVDLTIIVVDNDGGGIFSFLPQADALAADRFEQLYGTPHGVDVPVLGAAHGLITVEPSGAADVSTAIAASVAAKGSRIVRIATDRAANVSVHEQIHDAVAAAVRAALDGLGNLRGG